MRDYMKQIKGKKDAKAGQNVDYQTEVTGQVQSQDLNNQENQTNMGQNQGLMMRP